MKGYVRLREPDEEIFLGDGAGCVQTSSFENLHYRVWDKSGLTMFIPANRLVTIRLGTGKRPEGYKPIGTDGTAPDAPVLVGDLENEGTTQ